MTARGKRSGFTIIELIVVITIIGILAAIAIPQYYAYKLRTYEASVKSALRNLSSAEESYYTQFEVYTKDRTLLNQYSGWTVEPKVIVTIVAADTNSWSATASYMGLSRTYTYSSAGGGLK